MKANDATPYPNLSGTRHHTRYRRDQHDFSFAREMRTVPISLSEAAAAASCFPLVFLPSAASPTLHVLLRRSSGGHTVFIGSKGRWQAAWLPPRLSAWPFDLMSMPDGTTELAIHEDNGTVSLIPGGLRIFDPKEESEKRQSSEPLLPTDGNARMVTLLNRQAREHLDTLRATQALEQLGLLTPLDDALDLHILDAGAAKTLTEARILYLHRSRALALLHIGLASLTHLAWMERAEQHQAVTVNTTLRESAKSSDQRDFLSALSDAHYAEAHQIVSHQEGS